MNRKLIGRIGVFLLVGFTLIWAFALFSSDDNKIIGKQNSDDVVDVMSLQKDQAYDKIFEILVSPSEYLGKEILVRGIFKREYNEEFQQEEYFIVITDEQGDCETGIDIIINSGKYPQANKEVSVIGIFSKYEKNGVVRYYLDIDNSN
ncbi:MAG: hypothetical protein ACK5KQ_03765 [Anaerorhabdus sp.]